MALRAQTARLQLAASAVRNYSFAFDAGVNAYVLLLPSLMGLPHYAMTSLSLLTSAFTLLHKLLFLCNVPKVIALYFGPDVPR